MKVIRIILTPIFLLSQLLLYFELKKNYVIMYNDDKKNGIFSLYNRKDLEYLL